MRIIQLKNYTPIQMTGFIIITDRNDVIVVDGGNTADTDGFLARLGSVCKELGREPKVDLWLMTHPHDDHFGVLLEVSKRKREGKDMPEVGCIMYCPQPESFAQCEPCWTNHLKWFNDEMNITPYPRKALSLGQVLDFGNLKISVLHIPAETYASNGFNNASVVMKFEETRADGSVFSFLVLGDLGIESSNWMLENVPGETIKADAVQMAHHGQNGATEELYRAVDPRFTFWPTPDWLWENTIPGLEKGKGPWRTLEVRSWIREIGSVFIRPVMYDIEFDTKTETWYNLV